MKRITATLLLMLSMTPVVFAMKPNVILILTDDQGYGDLSAHGNPVIKTPKMDKLRAESVRLTDFHVAPMCTPTRGQLMSGMDAMRNGATAVCQGRSMMRGDIKIMPQFFAEAGYATGLFGKWHLGDSYPHRPRFRGFQEVLSFRAWGITSLADYWNNGYFDPMLMHNGVDKKYPGYCTDIFFNEAMKWVEKCLSDQKPFFLYLPTNTPHVPEVVGKNFSTPYIGMHGDTSIPSDFYGMIANIDENLGRLESFLKEKGIRNNTILIFMSDNGTQNERAQTIFNAGMRERKRSVFEGGHRVHCFVRWIDGKLQQGRDITELTEVQDLLPTLAGFCGLNTEGATLDGTSLSSLLKGTEETLADRMCVIQYRVSGQKWNSSAVLWNQWRLVGEKELFNIENDPHQDKNIYDEFPEVAKKMTDHYNEWYAEAKQLYDRKRFIVVGSPKNNPSILYASDWQGSYCDNRGGLKKADGTGYWDLIVEQAGIYEIALRRWPKESNKTFTEGYEGPADQGGSARPITVANVEIAGGNYTLDIPAGATHVTFNVRLPKGKTRLATALMNAKELTLCSAMYVYVRRLDDGVGVSLTPASDRKPKGRVPVKKGVKPVKGTASIKLSGDDRLLADFEDGSYGNWKTTGSAFGTKPTTTKGKAVGHQGARLVDTFITGNGDQSTGTLTSPAFRINRRYLNFLIGGGNHAGKTCVNLVINGQVVHSATGLARKDHQGRKIMKWVSWDLSKWQDTEAQIVVVDDYSGGWGHIMVDQIFLSNKAAAPPQNLVPLSASFRVDDTHLQIPVMNATRNKGDMFVWLGIYEGERLVQNFNVSLPGTNDAFWMAAYPLEHFGLQGRRITIKPVDGKMLSDIYQKAFERIRCGDGLASEQAEDYAKPYRNQFHVSTRRGWNNDPNGMVYHDGKYHLYYQYNPFGIFWGNMHWGHFESEDLVHWKEKPIALYQRTVKDMAYSGGGFVDVNNSAGLGENTLFAAFTSTGRGECLAYSKDGGLTFTELPENPVVEHTGRDPNIIWYEPG
ncbi:MAG: sulfatase-like hydrolase/transferase, partial [Verrucomicrobiota bacterium]|nr:sulfatase-like hydrolase/transferase [Verrucomicrobiota bacterium]